MSLLPDISARVRTAWGSRDEPESMRMLAETYWRFLLSVAALLVAGFSFYGGAMFLSALGPPADGSALLSGGGSGSSLDPTELKTVLEGLEGRALHYESIKTERPALADPSK